MDHWVNDHPVESQTGVPQHRRPLGGVALPGMVFKMPGASQLVEKIRKKNQGNAFGPEIASVSSSRVGDPGIKSTLPLSLLEQSNKVSDFNESRNKSMRAINDPGSEEAKSIKKSTQITSVTTSTEDYFQENQPINSPTNQTYVKAQQLLQKCYLAEQQVLNGNVKLGVLRKKILFDVVQRSRDAVLGAISFNSEEKELNELITEYKLSIPDNFDSNQTVAKPTSIPPISENGQKLLRTCEMIEKQINNGEVRMGLISKRVCLDVVKRTQDAVTDDKFFKNEEMELNKLIKIYKFKI